MVSVAVAIDGMRIDAQASNRPAPASTLGSATGTRSPVVIACPAGGRSRLATRVTVHVTVTVRM